MLAGTVHGGGDQAAYVGEEALRTRPPDVVLDHLVDPAVHVSVLLGQLLVGCLGGAAAAARRPRSPGTALRARSWLGQVRGHTCEVDGRDASRCCP